VPGGVRDVGQLITRPARCFLPGQHGWVKGVAKTCKLPGTTFRASLTSTGDQVMSRSAAKYVGDGAVSADGRYVAFESEANALVPNDGNGVSDIFLRDTATGKTSRVSVNSDGQEANGWSYSATISGNGRFVAFVSLASNLDTQFQGQPNHYGVFVHDRVAGTTTRISRGLTGPSNDSSDDPSISYDGRYVTFSSYASNLVPEDRNQKEDIFVFDNILQTIERVSVSPLGVEGNSYSYSSSISGNGRYVAFSSFSNNLVPETEGIQFMENQIFVRDLIARTTKLISRGLAGGPATTDDSSDPVISHDGDRISFTSGASDLVPGDTPWSTDIFLYDVPTATLRRVSENSSGQGGNQMSFDSTISGDGSTVAFMTSSSNLVPGDVNLRPDIFIYDVAADSLSRISMGYLGDEANGGSSHPSLSFIADFVVYDSAASNLVSSDTNGQADVFLFDR